MSSPINNPAYAVPFKESSKLTNGKYGIMVKSISKLIACYPGQATGGGASNGPKEEHHQWFLFYSTSIGLQISNQQGAIKMIKRIKWHHVEHHLLKWSRKARKGAINTQISSAHVRDWGLMGLAGTLPLQGRRKVWKSGGVSSNVVGIICPNPLLE